MKYILGKLILLAIFMFNINGLNAQITVTDNQTAQQLINKLVGANVAIFNPVLTCPQQHNGTFEALNTNLGLGGGIVLSTGTVSTIGGNAGVGVGQDEMTGGDPDLSNLINEVVTNDACVLEFDFIPDIDTTAVLSFSYVFASEEYNEYVCTGFNDVFGFLITGAPTYNNTNIALVPNTNIAVAINSINNGTPGSAGGNIANCNAMGPGSPFPAYYVDNEALNGQDIAFDGFTTVLQATAVVEPCSTYHMKLGVANAGDHGLQSAVFLLENSFSVDSVQINLADIIKTDSGYIAEGCSDAKMTIVRDTTSNSKKKLCFDYGGSATYGVDYNPLPYTIMIQPKQYETTIPIIPTQDFTPELPYETIMIRRLNCCTLTPVDSVELRIYDSLQITLHNRDTGLCGGDRIILHASGDGDINYEWSPANLVENPTDSFTYGSADKTTTFTVKASFMSCPNAYKAFTATVEPTPKVRILNEERSLCLGEPLKLELEVQPDDFEGYNYLWFPPTGLSDPYLKEPDFFVTETGWYSYRVTVQTEKLGCTGSDTISLNVKAAAHLTDVTSDFTLKYGDQMQLHAAGVPFYTWFPDRFLDYPNTPAPTAKGLEPTVFTVIGMNEYGCKDTAYVKMDIDYTMHEILPTAFSPNGDGRNDLFSLKNMNFQRLIEFRVFNRWGQEVYSTTDHKQGWDGTYKGIPQESGVYSYLIRVVIPDGKQRVYKGDVTLLR